MPAEICPRYTANLHVDGFVKVLVLLDESLHAVEGVSLIISSQESFSRCHPVLSLLTVTVKQLQGTTGVSHSQIGLCDKLQLQNIYSLLFICWWMMHEPVMSKFLNCIKLCDFLCTAKSRHYKQKCPILGSMHESLCPAINLLSISAN